MTHKLAELGVRGRRGECWEWVRLNTAGSWKTSQVREGGQRLRAQREVEKRGQDLELQSSQNLYRARSEWEGAAWFSV